MGLPWLPDGREETVLCDPLNQVGDTPILFIIVCVVLDVVIEFSDSLDTVLKKLRGQLLPDQLKFEYLSALSTGCWISESRVDETNSLCDLGYDTGVYASEALVS